MHNKALLIGQQMEAHPGLLAVAGLGEVIWLVAYVLIIRAGFKEKTCGMPLVAICLNITSEINFGFVCPWTLGPNYCPHSSGGGLWIWQLWFVVQAVVLYQFIRWGRTQPQDIPVLARSHFWPNLIGLLLLTYFGQYTFLTYYDDFSGNESTFIANLVMSVLFICMFYARPDLRGLSYGAAWCKMLGSLLIIVAMMSFPNLFPGHESRAFLWVVYGSIVIIDCAYIALLTRRRAQLRAGAA